MESSEVSSTVPLSKKAMKRQKKRERTDQLRELRKANRKERRKEEKQQRKQNPDKEKRSRKEDKERLKQAQDSGVRLVIDLSLVHLMTEKEIGSLCRQLTIVYVENKRSQAPFHIYFTSFIGPFKEAFEKFSPACHNWILEIREESYLEVFPDEKDQMIYLTADAQSDLAAETAQGEQSTGFRRDLILIIGGLIDRNRHKAVCYEEATKQGIKSAQLPLHLLEGASTGLKVLTTNQCVEMLLRYNETLDWQSAISSIYPKRKLISPKDSTTRVHPEAAEETAENLVDGESTASNAADE